LDWGLEPREPGKPGDRGLEPREAGDRGLETGAQGAEEVRDRGLDLSFIHKSLQRRVVYAHHLSRFLFLFLFLSQS
jgi:hypothetical protein